MKINTVETSDRISSIDSARALKSNSITSRVKPVINKQQAERASEAARSIATAEFRSRDGQRGDDRLWKYLAAGVFLLFELTAD